MFVEGLVIDCSSRAAKMFRSDVHASLPADRCVDWYPFDYAQADVPVQSGLHFLLPVTGDHGRPVDSDGDHLGVSLSGGEPVMVGRAMGRWRVE